MALPLGTSFLGTVNAYLVEDEHGVAIVDCGLGTDETWELLNRGLDELDIPIGHINRVLLTHAHHDHSGLAERIAAESGATIWAHKRDLDFFHRRYVDAARFHDQMRDWLCDQGTPAEEAAPLASKTDIPPMRTSELIEQAQTYGQDDRIEIGPYAFDVVWTPGHTPGHVCFVDAERSTVLCGDHILPSVSPNVGLHPDTALNPLPGYLASLAEFAESSFTVTLPGHGEPLFDIQSRARALRAHQLERRERVLNILSSDDLTPYQIGERLWADTKPMSWLDFKGHLRRNAIATLVAHLEMLREEGRVGRSDEAPYRYWREEP